jgi:hypothetical protein
LFYKLFKAILKIQKDKAKVKARMSHEPAVVTMTTEKGTREDSESQTQTKGPRSVVDNEYPRTQYTKDEQSLLKALSSSKFP